MRSRVQVSLPLQRSDFYHSFFCSGERLCVTHPLNPPPVRGTYYFSQRRFISITLFFVAGGETVCYLSPKPPLTFALPPSHLGIVCKQSLPSVWRRFCKGGLFFFDTLPYKRIVGNGFATPFFVAGRGSLSHSQNKRRKVSLPSFVILLRSGAGIYCIGNRYIVPSN